MSIEADAAPLICQVCKGERLDGRVHGEGVCGPWPPVATDDNVVTDDPARMPGCGCHAAREAERLRECLRQIIAVHDGNDAPWDAARYLAQQALSRDDRLRLWRGMGNDQAELPDDLSDADLNAMVARFTSNA